MDRKGDATRSDGKGNYSVTYSVCNIETRCDDIDNRDKETIGHTTRWKEALVDTRTKQLSRQHASH
jgi:NMD protein affecting ribosome stability and mRNA decay